MTNSNQPHALDIAPFAETGEAVLAHLDVSETTGLSAEQVAKRQELWGLNELAAAVTRPWWMVLMSQFKSVLVILLSAAAALSFTLGDTAEGAAILAVLVINSAIGFFTELRAVRSMEALRGMTRTVTKVRREGQVMEVPAAELVPGDIVLFEGGDIVTADIRLLEAANVEVNESTLTGESAPVSKSLPPLGPDTRLFDQSNMLFSGTAITRGTASGVIVATGLNTELGRIADLTARAQSEAAPLEKRLSELSTQLLWLTLIIAVAIIAAGAWAGRDIALMLKTGIALAVAAIPEGLPIVATMVLARGMWRMARRNVLIDRLSAVETLGATTVIMTDKTGTLTENRMTVARLSLTSGDYELSSQPDSTPAFCHVGTGENGASDPLLVQALEVGVLCNNASLPDGPSHPDMGIGDPLEQALLIAAYQGGVAADRFIEANPRKMEYAFDAVTRRMATLNDTPSGLRIAVKGAPESILSIASHEATTGESNPLTQAERTIWLQRADALANRGLRVIALAEKFADTPTDAPFEGLTLIGLVGLIDPPRSDVSLAIAHCHQAGIRTVMVTGDHAVTAAKIAQDLNLAQNGEASVREGADLGAIDELDANDKVALLSTDVFARVTPDQKLALIDLYQSAGHLVAMTGDGVNDAPALQSADIGVAMGRRGTQVAREASDMVLRDDAFASIVAAIKEGRIIYGNIRRFAVYLLSCNVSEILVVGGAALTSLPLPLLPLQILFLNLVTDVFPAFALGACEGDDKIMARPPRNPKESILERRHWIRIAGMGAIITVATLGALMAGLYWLKLDQTEAVTMSFLTLALAQLWHVVDMRAYRSAVLNNEVTRNPFVWGAVVLCIGLLLAALYLPVLSEVLNVTPPGPQAWTVILIASFVPVLSAQIIMRFMRRKNNQALF